MQEFSQWLSGLAAQQHLTGLLAETFKFCVILMLISLVIFVLCSTDRWLSGKDKSKITINQATPPAATPPTLTAIERQSSHPAFGTILVLLLIAGFLLTIR